MDRPGLGNNFIKSHAPKTQDSYQKQRRFCVNLLRKAKNESFENINIKYINND